LLVPDDLLHEGGTAPAVLLRPRDARPAGVVHATLPGHVVVPPGGEVGALRPRNTWHVRLQPRARVGPERFLGVAESDLHGGCSGTSGAATAQADGLAGRRGVPRHGRRGAPRRPRRLVWPRTSAFHADNVGSNPAGDTLTSPVPARGWTPPRAAA